MHGAAIKWVRMADQRSVARNDAFLFGLEDAF